MKEASPTSVQSLITSRLSLRAFDRLDGCFDRACLGLWTSNRRVILVAQILELSEPVCVMQLHILTDLCDLE
jgi:hypothetical protein